MHRYELYAIKKQNETSPENQNTPKIVNIGKALELLHWLISIWMIIHFCFNSQIPRNTT